MPRRSFRTRWADKRRSHAVLEIAVQPVGLLDQNDAGLWVLVQVIHHLAEAGTAGPLGRLHATATGAGKGATASYPTRALT